MVSRNAPPAVTNAVMAGPPHPPPWIRPPRNSFPSPRARRARADIPPRPPPRRGPSPEDPPLGAKAGVRKTAGGRAEGAGRGAPGPLLVAPDRDAAALRRGALAAASPGRALAQPVPRARGEQEPVAG